MKNKKIMIPNYTLGEELWNSISHGIGAALSIVALVFCIIKSNNIRAVLTSIFFGISLIILYTISCIYHALSPNIVGKKVMRVIDHCNVHLLVLGTYTPIALIGVGGSFGWLLFGIVAFFSIIGIVLSAIDVDRYSIVSVISHLISGWSILIAYNKLSINIGNKGLFLIILGGLLYTVGSILYGIGSKKRYMHSIFHFFCLDGSICHFFCILLYII